MSDSSRIELLYAEETQFGETPGARAQVTLTLDTQPTATDTMVLNGKTYTFQTTLTDVDGNILIGATLPDTKNNIIAAVNLDSAFGAAGTDYAASMTEHGTVFAGADGESTAAWINDDLVFSAKTPGTDGNAYASTETFTAGTNVFSGSTFAGGIDQAFDEIRLVSESLHQETNHVNSAEIRHDRQQADAKRTSAHAAGDTAFELSYEQHDDFMVAALQSAAWSSTVSDTQTTFSMLGSDNSINDSGSGFVAAGFLANQWIEVSGFNTSANNNVFKIVSVTTGKMVLSGGTVSTESAGDSIIILMGAQILNGITQKSFSLLRKYSDLTQEFAIFRGMTIDGMSLNITPDANITGSFTWIGKEEKSTKFTLASSENASSANEIINATSNVSAILENTAVYQSTSFSLTLANQLRQRGVIGQLGPISIGAGTIQLTGTIQAYFETKTAMDRYLNDTETSLAIAFEDDAGNRYVIDLPRVKFVSGQRIAGGIDQDIIADLAFTAYRNSSENITIRIVRFAA